jgi:hypothetical protein
MLPGAALGPPGELTGAAWLHSPWFDLSGPIIALGWRKVLQVFVFGDPHGKRTGKAFVEKSTPKNHRGGPAPNRVTRFPPLWEGRFAPSMLFLNQQSRGICDAGASKACRYPCSAFFLSAHAKTAQGIRPVHMSSLPVDGNNFVPRVDCIQANKS